MACKKCKLYQEQVNALEKFGRIESQTCAHQPIEWPQRWVLGSGHDMYNLEVVWICKRCWAIVRPSSEDLGGRLKATCNGKHNKGSRQFGLLLPKEGLVSSQAPAISQPQPSTAPVGPTTQQSKLRNFFTNHKSESSSKLSVQPPKLQEAKVQPSRSGIQQFLQAREAVSSPSNQSHGQASQVGQRQSQSTQQAPAKSRSRSSVSRASQLEVRQRATQGVPVDAQQEQAKTGGKKEKGVVVEKGGRKGSGARSKSTPCSASATKGASHLRGWFQRGRAGRAGGSQEGKEGSGS